MMMTELDGGNPLTLQCRRYGDAQRPRARQLLILHGLFGSSANWRSMAGRLAASHAVFCLDLRNHGRSPWHDDMQYAAMAADVARFIDHHQLQGAALLGHSMGGKVAMTLAQNRLSEIGKLIVVDIAPLDYRPAGHLADHLKLIEAMTALDTKATDRAQIDAALAKRIPDHATRRFLAQNLVKDADGYRWRLNLAAIGEQMAVLCGYENAQAAGLDALFIHGADSDYLTAASHGAIFSRFPNARMEPIENAGHWLHAEQPERLLALTRAFLD